MKKLGEILTKIIKDKNLDEKDFKDVFDGIIENEAENVDKEKKHNELKVKLDDAEKKNTKVDELEKQIQDKDKEINDLKIKYIDRFENGDPNKEKEDKKKDDGTAYESIDDLFEKGE